jgi:hypothetical protein
VLVERVAEPAGDPVNGPFEVEVVERIHLSALPADEVVVMLAAWMSGLETCDPVAEVDAVHEAKVGELVERPIDARDADRPALGTQPVEELLRREAAVLGGQVGDHGVTRPARSGSGATELAPRVVLPGGGVQVRQ